ncbi:MAG: hypothetical protein AMJ53_16995 [Gammaproteobacteria bacterium SG8_11]|nr:MAG: hypothetical protein AMJ53_16995 [Gammaproteobacteria bacterium SG8_11]
MSVSIKKFKRCSLVKMDGSIDSYTAYELDDSMKYLNENGVFKIVFDMTDVSFVSSRGWWVLINVQKACKRYNRGEIVLAGVGKKIRETMDVVGLGKQFKFFDDATSAVGHF